MALEDERRPLTPNPPHHERAPKMDDHPAAARPKTTIFRLCLGTLLFLGGIGLLIWSLPLILSAQPNLEVATILEDYVRRR